MSVGADVFTTSLAYSQILDGTAQPINYVDTGVGTIGLASNAASCFAGAEIPGVGFFVAMYGAARLGWDIGWGLGVEHGISTWGKCIYTAPNEGSRILPYFSQYGMSNE